MVNFGIKSDIKTLKYINVGILMDIPTATFVTGNRGETLISGGIGSINGLVGIGDNFKSTILHYLALTAADKVFESKKDTQIITYDTEMSADPERLNSLASKHPHLPKNLIYSEDKWTLIKKGSIPANEFIIKLHEYAENKNKDKNSIVEYEAFKSDDGKGVLKDLVPTFLEIDSLSAFESSATEELLTSGDIDGKETRTFAMNQGLFKTKFLTPLPVISNNNGIYMFLTGHLGEKIDMEVGPDKYNKSTDKKLPFLKSGDKIKGVPGNFFFLSNNIWLLHPASPLINKTTKLPEYPVSDQDQNSIDLVTVKAQLVRGKHGGTNAMIDIVVSKSLGVLPSLTELHYIRSNKYYGLGGNNTTFHSVFLPDINLTRTTVRAKLDQNEKLRRAINITSELLQVTIFHTSILNSLYGNDIICTPEELYEDIKKLGYDWNELLDTRGYWLINQYNSEKHFLSIIDLLKMRKGLYEPYFLKKAIKK